MIYCVFLLFVNVATCLLFVDDKSRAVRNVYRVPEFQLLLFAAMGGSVGAVLAQRAIRHKTRKQPFADMLMLIIGLQLGAVFGICALYLAISAS